MLTESLDEGFGVMVAEFEPPVVVGDAEFEVLSGNSKYWISEEFRNS